MRKLKVLKWDGTTLARSEQYTELYSLLEVISHPEVDDREERRLKRIWENDQKNYGIVGFVKEDGFRKDRPRFIQILKCEIDNGIFELASDDVECVKVEEDSPLLEYKVCSPYEDFTISPTITYGGCDEMISNTLTI